MSSEPADTPRIGHRIDKPRHTEPRIARARFPVGALEQAV
jgi:hypothetical protein